MWRVKPLINVRENLIPFQRSELLTEELRVAGIDGFGARHDVGKTPQQEHRTRHRPGKDGETGPLQDLSEIVGGADLTEHPTVREVIVVVGNIGAQIANHAVGIDVDHHAEQEECRAENKLRRPEPANGISILWREEKEIFFS